MIGRVPEEVFEFIGVFIGEAVFGLPGPADSEFLEAQHVHDSDGGETGSVEIGALGETGSDEEAAVGAPCNGEARAGGEFFCDEVFGAGNEVIEDILLLRFHTSLVPFLTVFATAAKIREDIDAAHIEPGDIGGAIGWRERDIEPAVGVEISGVGTVEFDAFLVDDKHGDFGTIPGGREDLR